MAACPPHRLLPCQALDLLLVSIGTDWARVVKAVFVLAQIRLLRTGGFSAGGASGGGGA